ncbi:LysR substrate-binding domain-containing protein [Kiloniella sp.]|uniref:LysR substrate-binding domain-containing protein n=1 Tax=Kiloniella sp. TaxID=1938587 RepID=UPI003B0152A5
MFNVVARHGSFAAAAEELNLTKGAISYQIKGLEDELGFTLFQRLPRGVLLTSKGQELLNTTKQAFDKIELKVSELRQADTRTLTIGVSTYFASRWLSPRLMDFMLAYPDIRLRVQPMIDQLGGEEEGIDLSVRWGNGKWSDMFIEPLFPSPSWPVGNPEMAMRVKRDGLSKAFSRFTLLRDRDDSNAWSDWFDASGLFFPGHEDTLIIPDPNVRVQAVIDGQGVALNDELVTHEIETGTLVRLSDIELADYGYYLAYPGKGRSNPDVEAFVSWLRGKSSE